MLTLGELTNYINAIQDWVINRVLTHSALIQIAVVIVLSGIAQFFSEKLKERVKAFHEKYPYFTVSRHQVYKEGTFLLTLFVLLWGALIFMKENYADYDIIEICAQLVTAWCAIRIFSYPFEDSFSLRFISISIMMITALNILGLFNATVDLMGKISVKIGLYEIGLYELSLLTMIKVTIYFIFIVWLIKIITTIVKNKFKKSSDLTPSQKVLFIKLIKIGLFSFALIISLQVIGLDLRSLAFFSGAIGLGVAFSLQKVFSNLISGFIILLDKSIKPGDVIAVGNTYGWVKKLNSRYVSLITRDGKEHLIPNELLITERVENWTFSDNNLRLHIPIHISYSSDLHLARKLMLEAVEGHPRILTTPTPTCQLLSLSDSSIDFEIRIWIQDPANGTGNITNDLLTIIWDKFKKNNIRVPSPQREIIFKPSSAFLDSLIEKFQEADILPKKKKSKPKTAPQKAIKARKKK